MTADFNVDYIVPGSGGIQVLHAGTDADEKYLQDWIGAHESVRKYIDSQKGTGDDYVQKLRNLTVEIFLIPTPGVTLFFDPNRARVQTFNTADGEEHKMPPFFEEANHSGSIVLSDGTRIDIMQGMGITLVSGNQIITTLPPPDPLPEGIPEPQADEFGPNGVQFYTYSSTNPLVAQAYTIKTSIHPLATAVLWTFDDKTQYAFTNGYSEDGTQAWSITAKQAWNLGNPKCAWLNVPNASENNAVSRALYTVNSDSLATWAPANPGTGWTNTNLDWHRDTESERVENWFKKHLVDILLTIGSAILSLIIPGIFAIVAATFRTVVAAVRGGVAAERAIQTAATVGKMGDGAAAVARGGQVAGTAGDAAGTAAVGVTSGATIDAVSATAQVAVRNSVIAGAEREVTTALVQKVSMLDKVKAFSSGAKEAARGKKIEQVAKYKTRWEDYNRKTLEKFKPDYAEAEKALRASIKKNPSQIGDLKPGTKEFEKYVQKESTEIAEKEALAKAEMATNEFKDVGGKAVRTSKWYGKPFGKGVKYKALGARSKSVLFKKMAITAGIDVVISVVSTVGLYAIMAKIKSGKRPPVYYDMDQYGDEGFKYDDESSDGSDYSSSDDSGSWDGLGSWDGSGNWDDSSSWGVDYSSDDSGSWDGLGSWDVDHSSDDFANSDDSTGDYSSDDPDNSEEQNSSDDIISDQSPSDNISYSCEDVGPTLSTKTKETSTLPSASSTSKSASTPITTTLHHKQVTVTVHVPYSTPSPSNLAHGPTVSSLASSEEAHHFQK